MELAKRVSEMRWSYVWAMLLLTLLVLSGCAKTGTFSAADDYSYTMTRGTVQSGDIHGLNGDMAR